MPPPPYRWAAVALAGLLVALAGLAYRAHLIDTGYQAGSQYELARATEARRLAALADAKTAEDSRIQHAATLARLKETHDRTLRDLSVALAASDHRNQRLSGRIAGMLDDAAGVRAGPPADPGAPGEPAGAAEADSTVEALIQTTHENTAICLRNAAQLVELQQFYNGLRSAE